MTTAPTPTAPAAPTARGASRRDPEPDTTLRSTVATMIRVGWRTNRTGFIIWTLVNVGILLGTALAVAGLYDTPAKIREYADAVAGGSLYAINGRVEGIDSLGGVIQDENTFVSSFLAPLIGMTLIARLTRSEEERGRVELLAARCVHRGSVPLAAMLLTGAVLVVNAIGMSLGVIAAGVPAGRGVLYAASLAALSFVFAGVAVLAAQLVLHTRGVYMVGFGVLLAGYLTRGVGDVSDSWVVWTSPLGWQEKVAAFGPMRAWALLVPIAIGSGLTAIAVVLADRRDIGSSVWAGGAGPADAGSFLRRPVGTAAWLHRPAIIGWSAGTIAFAAMFGALTNETVQAIEDNPSLADALGAGGRPEDGFLAMVLLYGAIIATAYVVQAIGTLRHEERAGRVEWALARPVDRLRWLTANIVVIITGLLVLVVSSTAVFGVAAAASLGDAGRIDDLIGAGLAYLPAELLVAAIALAAFGAAPRRYAVAWGVVVAVGTIALLGPGLDLDRWIRDLAPTTHVGFPPDGDVEPVALLVMSALTIGFGAIGLLGFRRRDLPQH